MEKQNWHIEKNINISSIVAIVLALSGFIIFYANIVSTLNVHTEQIKQLQADQREQKIEIYQKLDKLDGKMDMLIERHMKK